MKQAYEEKSWGLYNPIELTGVCKTVMEFDRSIKYYQVQRRIFGIPLWKSWVRKTDVEWFEARTESIYECGDINDE